MIKKDRRKVPMNDCESVSVWVTETMGRIENSVFYDGMIATIASFVSEWGWGESVENAGSTYGHEK